MTGGRSKVSRRRAIQSAAVAAGFVWSAPAVRSVQRLTADVGTPPPGSSTTGAPTVTRYTFSGEVTERTNTPSAAGSPCIIGTVATFTAEPTAIGTVSGLFRLCLVQLPVPGPVDITAEGSLTAPNGTLTGVATGTLAVVDAPPPAEAEWDLHLDIDITGGTGDYAGATGSATYDLDETAVEQAPGEFVVTFTGAVAGSFEVPA
jgi:hypothetical protein